MPEHIEFSRFADSDEVRRQNEPQRETRPQPEKERHPDYFQKQQEKEGGRTWAGGWAGGRSRE